MVTCTDPESRRYIVLPGTLSWLLKWIKREGLSSLSYYDCTQLMLKTLLSTTCVKNYHAIMHSMQVASQSASGLHPVVPTKCAWLCPCFTTFSRRAVKRSVLVEATKKDPEELVKRISRGEKVADCCVSQVLHQAPRTGWPYSPCSFLL